MPHKSSIIILAAGSSSRLGQPKQLLPYKGRTLLDYTLDQALAANIGEVYVILGANAELIRRKTHSSVNYIINDNWPSGMGSSIAVGVEQLAYDVDAVLILLCDQPFMTKEHLVALHNHGSTYGGIVLSEYKQGSGPPSYFSRAYFKKLASLTGPFGAKNLINEHSAAVRKLPFELGHLDIDTEEDLSLLE